MTTIPKPEDKPVLTADEVAAALGWGRSAVYQAVHRGEIPSLRLGRRIRIPPAKLREQLGLDVRQLEPVEPTPQLSTARDPLVELLAEVVARGIELAKDRGSL